jgi:crotonobetainyl-CoA:carnitine CoA-transferase CaiB-like acyl-CoA transferase
MPSGLQVLHGLKVLEFSHAVMGPACGLILADLGADVIKVEHPPAGELARRLKGSGAGYFTYFNRNKRSLMVDLKTSAGRKLCLRWVDQVDVVIENFSPGVMDRLGLGYETLKERSPRLIYCSMKGFTAGPYQNRLALDEVVQMMSGMAFMTGLPGKPMRSGAAVLDMMSGAFGALGILAALRERDQTGLGRLVEVGLFETSAFLMGSHMAQYAIQQDPLVPMSSRISAWGIYDLFSTADGRQIFIGITSDSQWERFCQAFELPELLDDPWLSDNDKRTGARPWLIPRLVDLFSKMSTSRIQELCEQARLPYAPVVSPETLFNDPHMQKNSNLLETRLPDGEMAHLPNLPLAIDRTKPIVRRQPPAPGEHNQEIIHQLIELENQQDSANTGNSETSDQPKG